jgi:hypothetical protein
VPHWSAALPDGLKEHLKDIGSPEEAAAALKRGLTYNPAAKPEDIRLKFPEGVRVDEGVQKRFGELCVNEGLTPKQAQALLDWQIKADAELRDGLVRQGQEALKKSWGARYEENQAKALQTFAALDKRMGGRLAQSLGGKEMALNPEVVEALHIVGALVSEESIGAAGAGAPDTDKPQSAEDAYKGMFQPA